jgi:hypothetical protein
MKSRNIVSKNLAMTFEKAFEMIIGFDYLRKLDNDSNVALVPPGTYLVKNFKGAAHDKIYADNLTDSVALTIIDRINNVAAFCHFHPINSLSQKLTEKSLAAIRKEFIDAGGNIANSKSRIIGGQDQRVRTNIINGYNKIFANSTNNDIKIDEDFFNQPGSNQSACAIIASNGSCVAKLDYKESEEARNNNDITPESHNIIKLFPDNKEDAFFAQCQYIKKSAEQNRIIAKATLTIRKTIADLLKIDVTSNGSNIFYDLTPKTYEELLQKDLSKRLFLHYYYNGCGLVSVQNMMRMDKNRKLLPIVKQRQSNAPRKHFGTAAKKHTRRPKFTNRKHQY